MVVLGNVSLCLQFVIYTHRGIVYTIFEFQRLTIIDDVSVDKHQNNYATSVAFLRNCGMSSPQKKKRICSMEVCFNLAMVVGKVPTIFLRKNHRVQMYNFKQIISLPFNR